jgi:hypothetical protein
VLAVVEVWLREQWEGLQVPYLFLAAWVAVLLILAVFAWQQHEICVALGGAQ